MMKAEVNMNNKSIFEALALVAVSGIFAAIFMFATK